MRLRRSHYGTTSFLLFTLAYGRGKLSFTSLLATAARLQLLEEVVALVVNKDECREVLNGNLPDGFHAKFRILNALDALD